MPLSATIAQEIPPVTSAHQLRIHYQVDLVDKYGLTLKTAQAAGQEAPPHDLVLSSLLQANVRAKDSRWLYIQVKGHGNKSLVQLTLTEDH